MSDVVCSYVSHAITFGLVVDVGTGSSIPKTVDNTPRGVSAVSLNFYHDEASPWQVCALSSAGCSLASSLSFFTRTRTFLCSTKQRMMASHSLPHVPLFGVSPSLLFLLGFAFLSFICDPEAM